MLRTRSALAKCHWRFGPWTAPDSRPRDCASALARAGANTRRFADDTRTVTPAGKHGNQASPCHRPCADGKPTAKPTVLPSARRCRRYRRQATGGPTRRAAYAAPEASAPANGREMRCAMSQRDAINIGRRLIGFRPKTSSILFHFGTFAETAADCGPPPVVPLWRPTTADCRRSLKPDSALSDPLHPTTLRVHVRPRNTNSNESNDLVRATAAPLRSVPPI